jgi:hypothetical protein
MRYLYVIAVECNEFLIGPSKVGISTSPESRLRSLQTGNPEPLAIAYWFPFEDDRDASTIEALFRDKHAHQSLVGEWFDIDPKDASLALCRYIIDYLCKKGSRNTSTPDHIRLVLKSIAAVGEGPIWN